MKIYFHGAAGDVTGSAYHMKTKHASVLVDCGLYQGGKEVRVKNRQRAKLEGGKLDAVVLSHAHLDHVGRLPLLTKAGYQGPIYATQATIDVATLILRDAFYLQKADLDRENRKRMRSALPPLESLYEEEDVRRLKPLIKAINYGQRVEIAPGVQVRLVDAGHVIGSASVELTVEEDGRKKIVVFSGDLGPRGAPLLHDPVPFERADAVIMESTYGDRNHRSLHETAIEARKIVEKAIETKAKILVPVFAVGRTQLLLYLLAAAFRNKTLPRFPVYLDSPLAIEATRVYGKHNELFDGEARDMIKSGELRHQLESVRFCLTADESRELNNVKGPCMIIAGSGMCTGGRIMHHLRHNLYRPETAVLIVGFQSPGTLGRQLVDGTKSVSIFGERIVVRGLVVDPSGEPCYEEVQRGVASDAEAIGISVAETILARGGDAIVALR